MSERALTIEFKNAINEDVVRPIILFYANFPDGALRIWTGLGDLVWDGNTFTGAGTLIKYEPAVETIDTVAAGARVTLNGLDSSVISKALNTNYQGRDCQIWIGMFDSSKNIVSNPITSFRGILDSDEITDSLSSPSVTMSLENKLSDQLRSKVYRYTDQDQQTLHPNANDRGLEFVPSLQNAKIQWGS